MQIDKGPRMDAFCNQLDNARFWLAEGLVSAIFIIQFACLHETMPCSSECNKLLSRCCLGKPERRCWSEHAALREHAGIPPSKQTTSFCSDQLLRWHKRPCPALFEAWKNCQRNYEYSARQLPAWLLPDTVLRRHMSPASAALRPDTLTIGRICTARGV